MKTKGILNRDVTQKECRWLDEDLKEGTIVYQFFGCTYGCVDSGVPVTLEQDKTPFNEVPWDAVDWIG